MRVRTSGLAREWWTFREATDGEPAFELEISPLDQLQMMEVVSDADQRDLSFGTLTPSQASRMKILSRHVHGWRGAVDEDGVPVEFSFAALKGLSFEVLLATIKRILEISQLSEDDRKN